MQSITDNPSSQLKMLGWLLHGAGLIAILGAGFAAYCLVYLPLVRKENAYVARIAVVDGLLDDGEEIQAEYSRSKDALEEIRNRAYTLRQRIPVRPCETEFLEQMNEAANTEGLEIRDYRRGEVVVKDTHSQLEIHVLCAGSYPEICGFLDRLARMPRISTVEKVTITSDSAAGDYPVDLTLRLYYGAQEPPEDERKARNG